MGRNRRLASLETRNGTRSEMDGEALPPPVTRGLTPGARRIAFLAVLLLVPACVGGFLLGGPSVALGALAGGLISVGNFAVLSLFVVAVTSGTTPPVSTVMAGLLMKLFGVGVSLGVIVVLIRWDPLGVLLGVSVIFPAVLLAFLTGRIT